MLSGRSTEEKAIKWMHRKDEFVWLLVFPVTHSASCQVGKHDEAWMILKQIHDTNMRARGQPEKVFTVSAPFSPASLGA